MLSALSRRFGLARFAIQKRLYVYDMEEEDGFNRTAHSGIHATVFGASGFLGHHVCQRLGRLSSSLLMPLNNEFHFRHAEHLKDLRTYGPTNKTYIDWHLNLRNQKQIQRMVANSNVVISCLGPRTNLKKKADFQFINIEAPQRIAHACKKMGVHRLIHFSSAGAEPDSTSLDFQTKYYGQEAVRNAFPNATIFRPCLSYGYNDKFVDLLRRKSQLLLHKLELVFDDLQTKIQPINSEDIVTCLLNALKMEESKGKTYELGGPEVITTLQLRNQVYNYMRIEPCLLYFDREIAEKLAELIYNFDLFSLEGLKKDLINVVVKPERYLTTADLFVEPVRFMYGVREFLHPFILNVQELDQDNDT